MSLQRLPIPFLILTVFFLEGCASKKDDSQVHSHDTHDESTWKEMDEFHMIMAETFHPFKDSANLEPTRRMASELMTAAGEWVSSELPESVDNEEMRTKLERLRAQAAALAEAAKSEDDNVIGERLTELHDTFHEIHEGWYRSR